MEIGIEYANRHLKRFDADFDELEGSLSGYAPQSLPDKEEISCGLGEVQARRLLQNKIVKSFKIRGEYHIPKQCVIDYVLSTHYAKYRQILKAQIP